MVNDRIIDEMDSADILRALQFSLSMEGLKRLSTSDLYKMENILSHWRDLSARELMERRKDAAE